MNTKAIAITAAVLAALLGVLAVAHVDDVDAADESSSPIELGNVQVGVGYKDTEEGAQFSAKISEQSYVSESYKVVWTISYGADNSEKTWTFTYTKGGEPTLGVDKPEVAEGTVIPTIVMERGDIGYYIITMSGFPAVQSSDVTYDFTITSQISLTIPSDGNLVLNTNHFSATVVTYNNCLASLGDVVLISETNYPNVGITFDDNNGKTIENTSYNKYIWYATGLPAGLTLNNGYISGMPVEPTGKEGKDVVLVVRDISNTNPGREYYGTLNVKVNAFVDPTYGITITTDEGGKLVGGNLSYVAVNGASLILKIDGANFNGKATVIDSNGIRTDIEITPTASQDVSKYSGTIPVDGVGTYIVKVVWDDGSRDITLRVVAQTAGTSGAGFVVVGN